MIKKILKAIALLAILIVVIIPLGIWCWYEFTIANTLDGKFYGRDSTYIGYALNSAYNISEYSPLIETELNKQELKIPSCQLLGKTLPLQECIYPLDVHTHKGIAKSRPLQIPLIRRTPAIIWFHEYVLENPLYKRVLYKVLENPCNYFKSIEYSNDKKSLASLYYWGNYGCARDKNKEFEIHFVTDKGNVTKKDFIYIDFKHNQERKQSYYGATSQDEGIESHLLNSRNSYVWNLKMMLMAGVAFQGADEFPDEMRLVGCKVMDQAFPINECIRPSFKTLDKPQQCGERTNTPCISLTAHVYLKSHPMMKEYEKAVSTPCAYAKKINRKNLLKICQDTPALVKPINVIFDFIDETGHVVDSKYWGEPNE